MGAHVFQKDILALQYLTKKENQKCYVLDATIYSNKMRAKDIIEKMKSVLGDLSGRMIGVLGLTFKAGTDDVRSSPAIAIVKLLASEGAYIAAYDPMGMKNAKSEINIDFVSDYLTAARGVDAIVILTEWDEFKRMNYKELALEMSQKIIFDYRNILDPNEAKGFTIYQLGKK
ncbi:MAG UNVERIFIED_CONTAM: hypothetical protein LVQ98_06600 [Rickettsiaceae bacterium]